MEPALCAFPTASDHSWTKSSIIRICLHCRLYFPLTPVRPGWCIIGPYQLGRTTTITRRITCSFGKRMSDIFLLGAGFSKAISPEMPVLSELSSQIRKNGIELPSPLSTFDDNLELWLSYLSQPHPWLRESQNLKNQAAAIDVTEAVGDVLTEKEHVTISNECPPWLRELTEFWHSSQSSVITFNYDTLIERTASMIKDSKGYNLSAGQFYPVQLTVSNRRDALVFGNNAVETFTLFKLHGSINWYYSGAPDSTGETIYYTNVQEWGATNEREQEWREAVDDKVPLIVPPTTEKVRFFHHETLKRIWTRAVMAIRNADRLFVCGYSLPVTDFAVRLFLHEGAAHSTTTKDLYVVNCDTCVVERYQELLGRAYSIRKDFVGNDAMEKLVATEFTGTGDISFQ